MQDTMNTGNADKQNDNKLEDVLRNIEGVRVVPFDLNREKLVVFDFTPANSTLQGIDVADTPAFSAYVFEELKKHSARAGLGKYNENRTIYDKSAVFRGQSQKTADKGRRTVHLGLDIWAEEGTPVLAALDGKVHSFRDNNAFGDYGPTIILQHMVDRIPFYTLYGHLNRECLSRLDRDMPVKAGQRIAAMGGPRENGMWPPHLHFEIIRDLQGKSGDFPGVCTVHERETYLYLCPDPNLLLKIDF